MTAEIERLEKKLANLIEVQEEMKTINSICRNKSLTDDEKVKQIVDLGYSDEGAKEVIRPKGWANKAGFASYTLTNNNAKINATRDRVERLTKAENTETEEYRGVGCDIEVNHQINRFRLYFDVVPTKEERTELKSNGFKWSPSIEAWQNYINPNSKYFIKKYSLETETK